MSLSIDVTRVDANWIPLKQKAVFIASLSDEELLDIGDIVQRFEKYANILVKKVLKQQKIEMAHRMRKCKAIRVAVESI